MLSNVTLENRSLTHWVFSVEDTLLITSKLIDNQNYMSRDTCSAECNGNGQVKSVVFPDFLAMYPDLRDATITIFDSLFLNPSHGPAISGEGISLSVDSIYGSKPTLNIHRRGSYLRQNFGIIDHTKRTGKSETVYRHTYGTGSGIVTHGMVPR